MPNKILIGLTGSISAYKMADVVSALTKDGHEVQCIMSGGAQSFVTPLVLETLSGRPVKSQLFGPNVSGTEHIDLARWADLFVIAPATANVLAKLAQGIADDLLTTVALATRAPLSVAPAMNTVMWEHPATRSNVTILKNRGVSVIEPEEGVLACGEMGAGKLASVDTIVRAILEALRPPSKRLDGRTFLMTAGPTTSAIDAVRYLTNHSTGRMGAAMAEEALRRGANVRYVLGTDKGVVRPVPPTGASDRLLLVEVRTAEDMAARALELLPGSEGIVATAAVLDYNVAEPSKGKQKRAADPISLSLTPSIDVLGALRAAAKGQWFLGFAAETDDVDEHGRDKLKRKQLDFLFANPVAHIGENLATGFAVDTNGGTLFRANGAAASFPVMSKSELASCIWEDIA